jgi:hypothetical protein
MLHGVPSQVKKTPAHRPGLKPDVASGGRERGTDVWSIHVGASRVCALPHSACSKKRTPALYARHSYTVLAFYQSIKR